MNVARIDKKKKKSENIKNLAQDILRLAPQNSWANPNKRGQNFDHDG